MEKPSVLVIGSSNVDMIMKMDKLPQKGETVTNAEFIQVYGGKGANQAIAACRAGADVTFINCVGNDAYTMQMVDNFKQEGINTAHFFHEEDVPSGHALVMIDGSGHNYLSVAPGANYCLTSYRIEQKESVIASVDIILIQYEILSESIEKIIELATRHGKKVIFNFAPAQTFKLDLLQKIEVLIVNEIEGEFLSDMKIISKDDAVTAARKIMEELKISKVVITLGNNGVVYMSRKREVSMPAFKVDAVDSTGAGDTFCGYLTFALSSQRRIEESLELASAASALSVTKLGAQPSIPIIDEVNIFMKKRGE